MRISFKDIKKLSVETLSGIDLGRVVDIILDDEDQHVVQYEVKRSLKHTFLISRDQIVRFEQEKVIVYDTAIPKDAKKKVKMPPILENDIVPATFDEESA